MGRNLCASLPKLRKMKPIKINSLCQAIWTYSLFQLYPSQSKAFHNYGKILELEAYMVSGMSSTIFAFEVIKKVEMNIWLHFPRL